MPLSPACLVNGSATTNGVNVAASAGLTIALASTAGVKLWSLTCIGTDDTSSASTVTAGLTVVGSPTFSATGTAGALGTTYRFQSVVGINALGYDANGVPQPSYTTTFGVYVETSLGYRVLAINEKLEGSAAFGWVTTVNAIIRGASAGGAGNTVVVQSNGVAVAGGPFATINVNGGGASNVGGIATFATVVPPVIANVVGPITYTMTAAPLTRLFCDCSAGVVAVVDGGLATSQSQVEIIDSHDDGAGGGSFGIHAASFTPHGAEKVGTPGAPATYAAAITLAVPGASATLRRDASSAHWTISS